MTQRKKMDKNSPEYKRELYVVAVIVTTLTLLGGFLLGYKINSAEAARKSGEMERVLKDRQGKVPGPEHGIIR